MNPDPSVSNSSKASLISCFCSSVSSGLGVVFLRGGGTGPCRDGLLALVACSRQTEETMGKVVCGKQKHVCSDTDRKKGWDACIWEAGGGL